MKIIILCGLVTLAYMIVFKAIQALAFPFIWLGRRRTEQRRMAQIRADETALEQELNRAELFSRGDK